MTGIGQVPDHGDGLLFKLSCWSEASINTRLQPCHPTLGLVGQWTVNSLRSSLFPILFDRVFLIPAVGSMSYWTIVSVLVALVASAICQEYELDQNKLDQRYNLIQSLVAAGIPGKGGYAASHKPTIGAAYAYPNVGYSHGVSSYSPQTYGGYNVNNLYGAGRNYGNQGYGGYGNQLVHKPGGGVYHPLFDNKNLYKPRQTYSDNSYDNYNSKDPIYIGGSKTPNLYSQTGYQQKTAGYQPQLNAYGARAPSYNGYDAGGAAYTGQKGSLYQNLPGYTNPYFNKY